MRFTLVIYKYIYIYIELTAIIQLNLSNMITVVGIKLETRVSPVAL